MLTVHYISHYYGKIHVDTDYAVHSFLLSISLSLIDVNIQLPRMHLFYQDVQLPT